MDTTHEPEGPLGTEPAITWGSATAVVAAVLTLLAAFGADLSSDQTAAILGVVAVFGPLVAAGLTRRWAWAPASVARAVAAAAEESPPAQAPSKATDPPPGADHAHRPPEVP